MPLSPPKKSPPWMQTGLAWLARLGHPVVLATVATGVVVLGSRALGLVQGMELAAYDQFIRLRPEEAPDDRILVVGITEADIQGRQEWPIRDQTVADLLNVLIAAEPRAIGLDLFRDVPIEPGNRALLDALLESDRTVAVCKISSSDNSGVAPPVGLGSLQVGFSDLVVDPGGTLRRNLLLASPHSEGSVGSHLCNSPREELLSLGLQLALIYLQDEGITPDVTEDSIFQLGDVVFHPLTPSLGGYQQADAAGYQIMLNYRSANNPVPQVSLTDVLEGRVPPEQIRDRVVLIGATTPEAKDEFYTPYSAGLQDSQKMPGVVVHAQSVSQLLSAVLDGRPLVWSWSGPSEGLWIVLWGLTGAVFAWFVRRPIWFALGAIALMGGLYGSTYLIFLQGGWIPLVPPAIALTLAAGSVVLVDRFNKSDYGKAMYRQVKTFLKLDIEIDEARVGQQVAEITETDYFVQLKQRARDLRERKSLLADSASEAVTTPLGAPNSALENLPSGAAPPPPALGRDTPTDAPSGDKGEPSELDFTNTDTYFEALRREAKRLKFDYQQDHQQKDEKAEKEKPE